MRTIGVLCVLVLAGLLSGCGPNNDMTQDDIKKAAKSGPPTDAQRKQMANGMAAGFQRAMDKQAEWAKAHPDKVAEVNAQRAKSGQPPLPTN